MMTPPSEIPKWFQDAVSARYEEGWTEVRGCRVHYLRWGDAGRPASCGARRRGAPHW